MAEVSVLLLVAYLPPPRGLCFHPRYLVLFVSRILHKLLNRSSQNSVASGPRKKPLDFGDNSEHVTVG